MPYTLNPFTGQLDYYQSGASSPLTTKGDVWGYGSINSRIPVGSNGQVLTADSTQTLGLKWAPAGSIAIGTAVGSGTAGSLLYIDGSGNLAQENSNLFWDETKHLLSFNGAPVTWGGGVYSNISINAGSASILDSPTVLFKAWGGQTWVWATRNDDGRIILYDETSAFQTLSFSNNAYGTVMAIGNPASTNGFLYMQSGNPANGELPAGIIFYNGTTSGGGSTTFLPGNSGSTSQKLAFCYYNIATNSYWSALEYNNVNGAGVYPNIYVLKSGGNFVIGSGSAGASVLAVHGLPTSASGLSTGDVWSNSGVLTII